MITTEATPAHLNYTVTFTGLKFDFRNPTCRMVDIRDIAHALARQCRYNGHTRDLFTTAEHCVRSSWEAPPQLKFDMLMHDAAETWIGDFISPIKSLMLMRFDVDPDLAVQVSDYEDRILKVVALKYGGPILPLHPVVKEIDTRMVFTERRDQFRAQKFLWPVDIKYPSLKPFDQDLSIAWTPQQAEQMFLKTFNHLAVSPIPVASMN